MQQKVVQHERFGISAQLGFLSPDPPSTRLSNSYYEPWENTINQLSELIRKKSLNDKIKNLPLLELDYLASEPEWRRAYVILAFLVHAWVWNGDCPQATIPPCLTQPFLSVCQHLGLQPALSYAGLCLWNWKTKDGSHATESMKLENLECLASFTGSHDEAAFYLVPDIVEAQCGPLPSLLLQAIEAFQHPEKAGGDVVISILGQCTDILQRATVTLGELTNETCEPNYFYTGIRPYLAGSKGMETSGLPNGIYFQRANGVLVQTRCAGGSAVQSALFPAIDTMVGVGHSSPMFEEMRAYMPGEHREFLREVGELTNIREHVCAHPGNKELQHAYNNCIESLKAWRSRHINLVTRYIVLPARQLAKKTQTNGLIAHEDEMQGTGGSALVPFLKQARDEAVPIAE